jgi:1-acyl-sn-glycerol-3-phosphate acyltransferase
MSEQNQETLSLEWEYTPPPTPYDLIRDSIPIRLGRPMVYFIIRLVIRWYNKLQVIGRENVINNWPCIITPNHTSHLDSAVVFSALPLSYINNIFTLAAKDYFFNNAAVMFIARLVANAIPIDRTGTEIRGLRLCLLKQRQGKSILLFPEGTRKSGNTTGKFNKGAIILSRKSRIPIIPAFIKGASDSLPRGRVFPRRHKCAVIFGEPVFYSEDIWSNLEDTAITADLENRVRSLSQTIETLENQR